ncbi:GPI mannosyltransferase 2 [Dipodascopsis tothii]|uniref:GPI mannosyltransferase 2 n=1 Tax=Dipodascopsis tothii TaxID=44089 RepID=UPI0034CF05F6
MRCQHLKLIAGLFVVVKLALFLLAQSVVNQYDTSSQLIFLDPARTSVPAQADDVFVTSTVGHSGRYTPGYFAPPQRKLHRAIAYVLARLTVWDTVFFTAIAERGYVYEQEYAFGWGWTSLIRVTGKYLIAPVLSAVAGIAPGAGGGVYEYAIAAVLIAHIGHFLMVVLVYHLAGILAPRLRIPVVSRPAFQLVTACMAVLSPAGIFLSAGYSESTFAALSFAAMILRERRFPVLAGLLFGLSCSLRGNGILWGLIYLYDLYVAMRSYSISGIISSVVGGSLIGFWFFSAQYMAYLEFCPGRPWCDATIPLIFPFVQRHYWNNGFLRYWRTWQIPNFFFAAPTLTLFYRSCRRYWPIENMRPYVIVQAAMGFMALFFWHVQIVTRIGSCMPLVFMYAAECISRDAPLPSKEAQDAKVPAKGPQPGWLRRKLIHARDDFRAREGRWIVRYSVTWILAQSLLFASFIPPA